VTVEEVQDLLVAAVKLELSTIPPYLCALYSMHPQGNEEAKLVIRSVVVEEMLHMVLAANVLNAIGGRSQVAGAEHAPRYPHELPDGVVLDLLPFTPEAIDGFLKVENPAHSHSALADDHPLISGRPELHVAHATQSQKKPGSIGEFYAQVLEGLEILSDEIGEQRLFSGDPALQVSRRYYYAAGGESIEVRDMASARAALDVIVEQGEGDVRSMYDDSGDLAHYFRFKQIRHNRAYLDSDDASDPTGPEIGVDYEAVYPMIANPRNADYADRDLRAASDAANRTWSLLLEQIDASFAGRQEELIPAVHTMFKLRDQSLVLLANPLPDQPGRNAGPTFEWIST
jgi:Ferritin-like